MVEVQSCYLDAQFSALQSNVLDGLQLLGYKPIIPQTDKTNIFWAYEGMEGRKINTNRKFNTK
jgi:hypothetical protein